MRGDGEGKGEGGTFAMDFSADEETDASDAVEGDLESGVIAPIAYFGHVPAVGFELGIA